MVPLLAGFGKGGRTVPAPAIAIAEPIGLAREIPSYPAAAVRVARAEVEEEGRVVGALHELAAALGHLDGVPGIRAQDDLERVGRLGRDVVLADPRGAIPALREHRRQAAHRVEALEVMEAVRVTVLAVGVVVLAREDHRPARAAARGRREGAREEDALGRERVQIRGVSIRIAVAPGDRTLVVGDEENDVGALGGGGHGEEQGQEEESHTSQGKGPVRLVPLAGFPS